MAKQGSKTQYWGKVEKTLPELDLLSIQRESYRWFISEGIREVIEEIVGKPVTLIDSGEATAAEVKIFLKQSGLAHSDTSALYQERQLCDDLDHFYVTDAATRFAKVAERFLGVAPTILEAVEIWGHDELRTN